MFTLNEGSQNSSVSILRDTPITSPTPRPTEVSSSVATTSERSRHVPAYVMGSSIQFEPLLKPAHAALLLGIHAKSLVKMARCQEVPGLRLGKHWRFRASDLNTYVTNKLNSACQPA
ncbi:helix-turn-helix domain-containing protein [Granulicella arctica]|uniref:helix-turn-helix domain-containing protein n=1 Tax=Granulicella arctica TaxID=940613 RepID=UPI0037BF4E86